MKCLNCNDIHYYLNTNFCSVECEEEFHIKSIDKDKVRYE